MQYKTLYAVDDNNNAKHMFESLCRGSNKGDITDVTGDTVVQERMKLLQMIQEHMC